MEGSLKKYFTQEDSETEVVEAEQEVAEIEPTETEVEEVPEVTPESSAEVPVEVSTEELGVYTPLSQERLKELLDARPNQDSVLNHDLIKSRIKDVEFASMAGGKAITCAIILDNGYVEVGSATVLDLENHNEEIGRHFAYQDAYQKLIPIAAFLQLEPQE